VQPALPQSPAAHTLLDAHRFLLSSITDRTPSLAYDYLLLVKVIFKRTGKEQTQVLSDKMITYKNGSKVEKIVTRDNTVAHFYNLYKPVQRFPSEHLIKSRLKR